MSTQELVLTQNLIVLLVGGVFGIAVVAVLMATFFTVEQRTTAIVQRLGKFVREAGPGLHVKVPFIDRVIGRVNLRVQQRRSAWSLVDNIIVEIALAERRRIATIKELPGVPDLDVDARPTDRPSSTR